MFSEWQIVPVYFEVKMRIRYAKTQNAYRLAGLKQDGSSLVMGRSWTIRSFWMWLGKNKSSRVVSRDSRMRNIL